MKWSRRAAGGLAWACRLRPLPLPQRGCPPPSAFPPPELAVPLAVSGSAALEFLVALVTRDIYYLRILPVSSRLLDPSLPPGGEMRAPFPWSKRSRGPQPGADLPLAHPGSALSPGWPGAPPPGHTLPRRRDDFSDDPKAGTVLRTPMATDVTDEAWSAWMEPPFRICLFSLYRRKPSPSSIPTLVSRLCCRWACETTG